MKSGDETKIMKLDWGQTRGYLQTDIFNGSRYKLASASANGTRRV